MTYRIAKGKAVFLALIDGCRARPASWEGKRWYLWGEKFATHWNMSLFDGTPWSIDDSTRKREFLGYEEAYRALADGCEIQASDGVRWKIQGADLLFMSRITNDWKESHPLDGPAPFRITKLPGEEGQNVSEIEKLKNELYDFQNRHTGECNRMFKRLLELEAEVK